MIATKRGGRLSRVKQLNLAAVSQATRCGERLGSYKRVEKRRKSREGGGVAGTSFNLRPKERVPSTLGGGTKVSPLEGKKGTKKRVSSYIVRRRGQRNTPQKIPGSLGEWGKMGASRIVVEG